MKISSLPVRDTNESFINIINAEHNKLAFLSIVALQIGEEIIRMAEKRKSAIENNFKESFLPKIKGDLKNRFYEHNLANFWIKHLARCWMMNSFSDS